MYDSCAQRYAHKYEQFFNLCSVGVRLVFVFLIGFICIFVYFCVSLDHFGFVLLVLLGLFFQYRAKRLAWKNISEMTYFVSSGTVNHAASIHSSRLEITSFDVVNVTEGVGYL